MCTLRLGAMLLATAFALSAQTAPLDLPAIATALEQGGCPEVLSLLPDGLDEWSRGVTDGASEHDMLLALLWAERDAPFALAAAVRLLEQSGAARETAPGLLAEIRACQLLTQQESNRRQARLVGGQSASDAHWLHQVGPAALQRARALAGRLLRQHPDSRQANELLLDLCCEIDARQPSRITSSAIARLGDAAGRQEWLKHGEAALHDLDLEAASAALVHAAHQPPSADPAARCQEAEHIFSLEQRVARMRQIAPAKGASELDVQLAHLRRLQIADADAAIAESRKLVEAGVEHALPFTILASDAALSGERDTSLQLLDKATALPGCEALYAALSLQQRLMPKLHEGVPADKKEELHGQVSAELMRIDKLLALDDSDAARIYCWLREEISVGEPWALDDMRDAVPAAIALTAELPRSPEAYEALLAAALIATDPASAREAVLQPIPATLRSLPDLALLRAAVYVALDLVDDRAMHPDELDRVLGDLERVQSDPRDAAYLRGVRVWAESTRPGADATLQRQARDLFVTAQRRYGERGYAQAVSALFVANAFLDEPLDLPALQAARNRDASPIGPEFGVPQLCMAVLHVGSYADTLSRAVDQMQKIDHAQSQAIAYSALAAAYHTLDDREAARRASLMALQAINAANRVLPIPHDRGVLLTGDSQHALRAFRAHASATIDLSIHMWIVPRVPGKDDLRRLSAAK